MSRVSLRSKQSACKTQKNGQDETGHPSHPSIPKQHTPQGRFLEASDIDADAIGIQGKIHPKQTYMAEVSGVEVEVERYLY